MVVRAEEYYRALLLFEGVSVEKKTINGFFKAFAIAFAKRKDEDVGEALKEAFDEGKKEEKKE